jgi:hypothetical protein
MSSFNHADLTQTCHEFQAASTFKVAVSRNHKEHHLSEMQKRPQPYEPSPAGPTRAGMQQAKNAFLMVITIYITNFK